MKKKSSMLLTEGTTEKSSADGLAIEVNTKIIEIQDKGGKIIDIKYMMAGPAPMHSALIVYRTEFEK